MRKNYIIGTRDSNLALKQCKIVKEKLQKKFPDIGFEFKEISTKGDRERDKKFADINAEGIFVREIEIALLSGEIDLAVHSFKDLPTRLPKDLEIAAIVDRANRYDVLAGAEKSLDKLPKGARLGTGSLRRKSQLLAYRSDLEIIPIRGNVETRLKKIESQNLDGVILAAAGLERLGLKAQITEYLAPEICLPAARQGAVAVEIRKESTELKKILKMVENKNTALEVWTEHAFLKEMEAGCHAPLAAEALIEAGNLTLTAAVGEIDGSKIIKRKASTKKLNLNSLKELGEALARKIKVAGAAEILARLKNQKRRVEMGAKVYLTGAGPGDPSLLTLKAKRAIEKADVILYDRLANNRFLEYASSEAEKIYVGKKAKNHHYTQSEIEALMIEKIKVGKTVCRLKGGDPFVYGRGGEEALKLKEAGIDFEIIPGISSSLAVPLYAGIPLTQRNLASSFAVITGHEAANKEKSTIDIEKIAAAVDTLVVLMGVGKLAQTVARVLTAGKSPETPVALIRWGSRSQQQTITGTLDNIVQKVEQANFKPPAVIVIGKVVNLRKELSWFENKKLLGKNILVTRPKKQSISFIEMIESEAGNAALAPTIKIKTVENDGPLQKAVDHLEEYSHLIFTSVNGVKYFMQELDRKQLDLRALAGIKIMTIGSKTAAELKTNGIRADFLPEDYSTSGILDYLRKLQSKGKINLKQASFLLPRADIAPKLLEEELRNMGAKVKNVEAYKTEAVEMKVEILNLLKNDELDLLTFTSSSTVDNFIIGLEKLIKSQNELLENQSKEIDQQKLWQQLKEIPTACIGPVTANQAKKYGLNVQITAAEYTIEGLFDAILKYYL